MYGKYLNILYNKKFIGVCYSCALELVSKKKTRLAFYFSSFEKELQQAARPWPIHKYVWLRLCALPVFNLAPIFLLEVICSVVPAPLSLCWNKTTLTIIQQYSNKATQQYSKTVSIEEKHFKKKKQL